MPASAWFLLATLVFTTAATALLCAAMMTDRWEQLTWSRTRLNHTTHVEWLLNGHVGRVVLGVTQRRKTKSAVFQRVETAVFLVPTHGGIWTLCVSLTDEEQVLLHELGYSQSSCVNYLSPEVSRGEDARPDWQHRMQNLSISCALVCLIVLGSAALVGAFGVFQHQISAVLVTGVMYLLAATFALFTLTIMHFKRQQTRSSRMDLTPCLGPGADVAALLVDGVSPSAAALDLATSPHQRLDGALLRARVFSPGWSMDLGWGGVVLCSMAAVLWLLLSKIMRYHSPLSSIMA